MFGRTRKDSDKPKGYIYIASNRGMPGIVKIGKTYKPPAKRLAELYSTGVPYPFELEYQCTVPDRHAAERFLHDFFSEKRVNTNREFFAVSANDAAKITHHRVANKKVRYKKPAGKIKRLFVLCLLFLVCTAVLYKAGHFTETIDSIFLLIGDYLRTLKTR